MAKKTGITRSVKAKKPTAKEQLATLKATISEYFTHLKYRSSEYQIKLPAKITGENGVQREHMVNVPSLIASIITAQGLGKEVRVNAVQDPTGGALLLEFYSPINIDSKVNLLS